MRAANSPAYGFFATSAPHFTSISLRTCGAFAGRCEPSTRSKLLVIETRRALPDSFRSFTTRNFTGASTATKVRSSDAMPSCRVSKIV